jgi:hypothetical protein|tara:strand:+ start:708 stop:1712 length:1005 start_codon:yes stop_codon:yes gene_type:complete
MNAGDGNTLGKDVAGASKIVSGTRWQEISADIAIIADMSHDIGARTEFLPLNGAIRPLTIQGTNEGDVAKVIKGLATLEPRAGYTTPLAAATARIYLSILPKVQTLMKNQQQVCVVIATDGKPTDSGFQEALKQLQTLPVSVVIRLCTDDDEVVDYYNGLDAKLEAPLEVLDDLRAEAREVCTLNRWLTYGQPLHIARVSTTRFQPPPPPPPPSFGVILTCDRGLMTSSQTLQQFGMRNRVFDDIDERPLKPAQVKNFCELLLGGTPLPEPEVDLGAFMKAVDTELAKQPKVYDPLSKKMEPWIKKGLLEAHIAAQSPNPVTAAAARMRLSMSI